MVPRWRFLATLLHPVFSVSRVQHVSDLHLKTTLRRLRLGEEKRKKEKEEQTTG